MYATTTIDTSFANTPLQAQLGSRGNTIVSYGGQIYTAPPNASGAQVALSKDSAHKVRVNT